LRWGAGNTHPSGENGFTTLRIPIYAHHDPYVLLLLPGDWTAGEPVRRAAELNQPAIPMIETYHALPLPQSASRLAVEPASIALGALKRAEDADALIVRCYETAGRPTLATLYLTAWNRTVETTFSPPRSRPSASPTTERSRWSKRISSSVWKRSR
jgi:alpha-mannosidase